MAVCVSLFTMPCSTIRELELVLGASVESCCSRLVVHDALLHGFPHGDLRSLPSPELVDTREEGHANTAHGPELRVFLVVRVDEVLDLA